MFDQILTRKLAKHLSFFIPSTQHGFMADRSTSSNLIEITQFITDEIRKGNLVNVIYFDLSKAFDVMDHAILAQKLAKTSIAFTLHISRHNEFHTLLA